MTIDAIKQRVLDTYKDAYVEAVDMTGTSDHIQILVVTPAFENKTRLQRQRMVMDIFQPELASGEVHALTIKAITPNERNL